MSWVIIDKLTGDAVLEFYSESLVAKVNREKYDVVTILEHLQNFNRKLRDQKNYPVS